MTSPVDVANMALDNIGARFSINSLTPPSPPPNADLVARHYQPTVDALLRSAHWNFARKQATLNIIKARQGTPENPSGTTLPQPPVPWLYEYAYPTDCMKVRFLIPNPPQNAQPLPLLAGGTFPQPPGLYPVGAKFAVASDTDTGGSAIKVILADLQYAQAVYTARIDNPDLWDPSFVLAAAAALGAWLVRPTNGKGDVLKEQVEIASSIIKQARISDGNEGVTSTDNVPDWMAVRGFSGWNDLQSRDCYQGWDSISFPGGMLV